MINFAYLEKIQEVARLYLKNVSNGSETEVEFSSWVIPHCPQPPTCPTMPVPGNVFLWCDTITENWIMFSGNFWKFGDRHSRPKLGSAVNSFGWRKHKEEESRIHL